LSLPWSVSSTPSHSSLAKSITWPSLITFIELEGAAATLPDLHLRKLVGHRPSSVTTIVVFSKFVESIPE
jgi:hypothetical protein